MYKGPKPVWMRSSRLHDFLRQTVLWKICSNLDPWRLSTISSLHLKHISCCLSVVVCVDETLGLASLATAFKQMDKVHMDEQICWSMHHLTERKQRKWTHVHRIEHCSCLYKFSRQLLYACKLLYVIVKIQHNILFFSTLLKYCNIVYFCGQSNF